MTLALLPPVVDYPMIIDGQPVAAAGGEWTDVQSPGRRGTVLGRVPRADEADVDRFAANFARLAEAVSA